MQTRKRLQTLQRRTALIITAIVLISLLAMMTGCRVMSADSNLDDSVSSNAVDNGREYADTTQQQEEPQKGIISSIVGKTIMAPECKDVSISLLKIEGKKELCLSKNTLNIGIINDGEITLRGIDLYTDSKIAGELVTPIRSPVGVGSSARQFVRYDEEKLGKLDEIVIVPVITVDGEETSCSQKAIKDDDIGVCG